jgi:toxin FitB
MDLMIAAIAPARDLPLYPRNGEDFTGLGDMVEVVGI